MCFSKEKHIDNLLTGAKWQRVLSLVDFRGTTDVNIETLIYTNHHDGHPTTFTKTKEGLSFVGPKNNKKTGEYKIKSNYIYHIFHTDYGRKIKKYKIIRVNKLVLILKNGNKYLAYYNTNYTKQTELPPAAQLENPKKKKLSKLHKKIIGSWVSKSSLLNITFLFNRNNDYKIIEEEETEIKEYHGKYFIKNDTLVVLLKNKSANVFLIKKISAKNLILIKYRIKTYWQFKVKYNFKKQ